MTEADHEVRILAIAAFCSVEADAARVLYQDFVVAATSHASNSKMSFREAMTEGWEIYRNNLVWKADPTQAQATTERWFAMQETMRGLY